MHVAIDGVGNHVGGGWSVLTRTVRHLAGDDRISRITVFCSPLDEVASAAPRHPRVDWVEHGREHRSPRARMAWFSIGLDSEVDRVRADVVLTLNGVGRTTRPRVCLVQQAFAVWGKLRRVRPRRFAAKLGVLRRETAKSVREADAVVVQTSWMRQRMRDVLERQAFVLPLGLPVASRRSVDVDPSHVAIVGNDLPYKRNDVARAAVALASKRRDVTLQQLDDAHPDEVGDLLAAAGALIVSSDVESFGLPIVEAFAAGCPVVLTDCPWARAVADNGATYFDHAVPASAARRILELVDSPALADDVRERGRARLATLWADDPYTRLVDLLEDVA